MSDRGSGGPVEDLARQVVAQDVRQRAGDGRPGKPGGVGVGKIVIGVGVGLFLVGSGVGFFVLSQGGGDGGSAPPKPVPGDTSSTSAPPATLGFVPNTVFDGCFVIDPAGSTTDISAAFTLSNPQPGSYRAIFAQSPSGPLSGSGSATHGANPIVIPMRATAFGTYDDLSITAPDGSSVDLGPIADLVPFELNAETDRPNGCDPSALQPPSPRAVAGREYLAAVEPVNGAAGPFVSQVATWTDSTGAAEAQADAAPFLGALQEIGPHLLELAAAYPPAAESLRAQHDAVEALVGDLEDLARLDEIGVAAWRERFDADLAKLAATSDAVRDELGLPATSG